MNRAPSDTALTSACLNGYAAPITLTSDRKSAAVKPVSHSGQPRDALAAGSHVDLDPDHYRDSASDEERLMRAQFALVRRLDLVADSLCDPDLADRLYHEAARIEGAWFSHDALSNAWAYLGDALFALNRAGRHRERESELCSFMVSLVEQRSLRQARALFAAIAADRSQDRPLLTARELDVVLNRRRGGVPVVTTRARRSLRPGMTRSSVDQQRPSATEKQLAMRELVSAHVRFLRCCTRASDLDDFAVTRGLSTPDDFGEYVIALRVVAGVDLAAVRALDVTQQQTDSAFVECARRGPRLTLWCAGRRRRFTVAGSGGQVVWRDLHPADRGVSTLAQAAQSAALQAIWLAGRAVGQAGWDAGTLRLVMEHRRGITLVDLHHAAIQANLLLEPVSDPDDNPAVSTVGYQPTVHWHRSDPLILTDPHQELP